MQRYIHVLIFDASSHFMFWQFQSWKKKKTGCLFQMESILWHRIANCGLEKSGHRNPFPEVDSLLWQIQSKDNLSSDFCPFRDGTAAGMRCGQRDIKLHIGCVLKVTTPVTDVGERWMDDQPFDVRWDKTLGPRAASCEDIYGRAKKQKDKKKLFGFFFPLSFSSPFSSFWHFYVLFQNVEVCLLAATF